MLFSRFVDWIIYSMTPIRAGISRIMFLYIEKNPVLSKAETFFTWQVLFGNHIGFEGTGSMVCD
jgi:hypothetical protein